MYTRVLQPTLERDTWQLGETSHSHSQPREASLASGTQDGTAGTFFVWQGQAKSALVTTNGLKSSRLCNTQREGGPLGTFPWWGPRNRGPYIGVPDDDLGGHCLHRSKPLGATIRPWYLSTNLLGCEYPWELWATLSMMVPVKDLEATS